MARAVGLSRMAIHRIWHRFGLQPHRSETFKLSNDPLLIDKIRDIVGLYLNPPSHAAVFCVDEKPQIQALDRTQPPLPMQPGQVERRTHDYKRHGRTTVFAALNATTSDVITQFHQRHRSARFREFLDLIDARVPRRLDVHIIMDNYGTHTARATTPSAGTEDVVKIWTTAGETTRASASVERLNSSAFSRLQFAALRMTIVARRRADDDEQFRREAEPSIVLNEGGQDRRERQRADAGSESKVVAARRVGRGRALANGTRGEEDLRTTIPSLGFARTESDSSHVPGNSNPNAICSHGQNERAPTMLCDSHAARRVKTDMVRIHARSNESA